MSTVTILEGKEKENRCKKGNDDDDDDDDEENLQRVNSNNLDDAEESRHVDRARHRRRRAG